MNSHGPARIALVAWHSSPLAAPGRGDAGGMNVYVLELARALARRGAAVDVWTSTAGAAAITRRGRHVRLVEVPAAWCPPDGAPMDAERLLRAFATAGLPPVGTYATVHSHHWRSLALARPLAARFGADHVHSFHTNGRTRDRFLCGGEAPMPAERHAAEAACARHAGALVVSTAEERRELEATYDPSAPIVVIPPGVDRRRFAPAHATGAPREGAPRRPVRLAAVARIHPVKALDLAIAATPLAAERLARPVELVIAGGASGSVGGAEARRLRVAASSAMAASPGSCRIVFAGVRSRREVSALLRASDAALVSSRTESFGLTALEALACGTPVVGTPVGALPALLALPGCGAVVRSPTPARFADRVAELLATHDGRAVRAHALAAAAPYSWSRTAAALHALYAG